MAFKTITEVAKFIKCMYIYLNLTHLFIEYGYFIYFQSSEKVEEAKVFLSTLLNFLHITYEFTQRVPFNRILG